MTLEDWAARGEDEHGELVDGHLVEEEGAGVIHELVISFLIVRLWPWAEARGGSVVGSNVGLAVSLSRGRLPDLSVFLTRRPPAQGLVRVPPDIAVEVVSPSPRDARRDRVEKFEEYAIFGVESYWIVDPALRSFEVFQRTPAGRYERVIGALAGVVEPAPGLTIDLDALWARLDAAEREG